MEALLKEKLKNLHNIYNKYIELDKRAKGQFTYRINAIDMQIDVLEEILNGETDVKDWEECFEEDSSLN